MCFVSDFSEVQLGIFKQFLANQMDNLTNRLTILEEKRGTN